MHLDRTAVFFGAAGDLPVPCARRRCVFHHPAVAIFFDVMTTAEAGRGERWI